MQAYIGFGKTKTHKKIVKVHKTINIISGSRCFKKLESHMAIVSSDSYAFLVLSNLLCTSITQRMHANHEPFIAIIIIQYLLLLSTYCSL